MHGRIEISLMMISLMFLICLKKNVEYGLIGKIIYTVRKDIQG